MKRNARARLAGACAALLVGAHSAAAGLRAPVPGDLNPAVNQNTIKKTICVPGWTATVRPPVQATNKIKRALLAGESDKNPAHYELDHLISLQLGGAPLSLKNLWLEPYAGPCGARVKDVIETRLKREVCAGRLSLVQAQRAIRVDWMAAYRRYVGPLECGSRM